MTRILREAKPLAIPTPKTAPTKTWVVETGKPVYDAALLLLLLLILQKNLDLELIL